MTRPSLGCTGSAHAATRKPQSASPTVSMRPTIACATQLTPLARRLMICQHLMPIWIGSLQRNSVVATKQTPISRSVGIRSWLSRAPRQGDARSSKTVVQNRSSKPQFKTAVQNLKPQHQSAVKRDFGNLNQPATRLFWPSTVHILGEFLCKDPY